MAPILGTDNPPVATIKDSDEYCSLSVDTNMTVSGISTLNGNVVDTGTHTTILSGGDYNLVAHYSDSANFGMVYTGCDYTVQFNMPSPNQILANAVISPISGFGFRGEDYEIPEIDNAYATKLKNRIVKIQTNKTDDPFGWRVKV